MDKMIVTPLEPLISITIPDGIDTFILLCYLLTYVVE
jgi:hypothetical protein